MIKIKQYFLDNRKIIELSAVWFVFFLALNSKWNYGISKYNLTEIINMLRFLSLYSVPLLFYFYFFFVKKYKFNNNIVLYSLYLYCFSQIVGFANFYFFNEKLFEATLMKENLILNGYNLKFSYSFFTGIAMAIPIPLIAIFIKNYEDVKKIFYLSLVLLSLITLIYSIRIFYEWIIDDKTYLYYVPYLTWGTLLDMPAPRATGIARWYLILFLSVLSILIIKDSKHSLKFLILLAVLGSIIYLFQSRTSVYFLFFSCLFIFFKKQSFYKNLIILISLIFLIITGSNSVIKLKQEYNIYNMKVEIEKMEMEIENMLNEIKKEPNINNKELLALKKIDLDKIKSILENKVQHTTINPEASRNLGKEGNYSSGRRYIWREVSKYLLKFRLTNLFFGYGSQADRYLVTQNASNGILYILITSGILGLSFFSIIYLKIFQIFYILFKYRKKIKQQKLIEFHHIASIFIILFFSCRVLVENSFTIYGLDYLFFLISFASLFNLHLYFQNISHKN
tara:strand:- start:6187 stop:7713 length:1527 start_codon:yes stop_codon:yes gene_type:complete